MQEHGCRYHASRFPAAMAALLALLIACSAAAGERHEVREGDLVLRSNLMAYGDLDPATAARQDIPRGKNRAVLQVALVRATDGQSVRARVSASSRNQDGGRQKILVREMHQGPQTSYIGSFEFTPGQELEFVVEARPAEGKDKQVLSLAYRERMPPE